MSNLLPMQVVFTFFFCIYIADFYQLSPRVSKDEGSLSAADAVRISQPSVSLLSKEREIVTINTLPGAIKSTGKTFDSDSTSNSYRDRNTLPGAIGSRGAFDNYDTEPRKHSMEKKSKRTMPSSIYTYKKEAKSLKTRKVSEKHYSTSAKKGKPDHIVQKANVSPVPSKKSFDGKRRPTKRTGSTVSKAGKEKDIMPKEKKSSSASSADFSGRQISSKASLKRRSKEGKASATSDEAPEQESDSSLYSGPHPMNRNMKELQVAGDTGPLDEEAVRGAYEKLVEAYLAPFVGGIKRRTFFEVLRRKTYSLTPPGANKGIQTILFQIIDKSKRTPNFSFE